jgi:PPOX class probable F420-dependent enzyme
MPSRRAEITLGRDEVAELLRTTRTLVLCTIGPDGLPDPVAMWFVVRLDATLDMSTYGRSQKVVNLRRDPRAGVMIEDGDVYEKLRGVQLSGEIEIVEDTQRVLDVIMDHSVKYHGATGASLPRERDGARQRAEKRVLLRFRPSRTVSWDHSKL